MLYLLKVYALVAAVVFAAAGLIILSLFVWYEAKTYAAAQLRIYKRIATFANPFANPLVISRTVSRSQTRASFTPHKIQ